MTNKILAAALAVFSAALSSQPAHAWGWPKSYSNCEMASLLELEIQQEDARLEERRRCNDENPNAARAGRCTFTPNSFWLQGRTPRSQQLQMVEKYRQKAQDQGQDCSTEPNRIRDKR